MRWAAFIFGELVLLALLAVIVFVGLLYQATSIWIAAPLVMLVAVVAIAIFAKSRPRTARLVTFLAPLALVLPIASVLFSFGAASQGLFAISLFGTAAYYVAGVLLLGAHYLLNAKIRLAGN
jgi:hypothetical protein